MKLRAVGFSEAGRGKPNQDAYLIKSIDESRMLIAIADGMGGTLGGGIASSLAVETISNQIDKGNFDLTSLFFAVKKEIDLKGLESPEYQSMGTTLTVASIDRNHVVVGHIGDTRLYHLRNNGIIAKTKDQTEVQKLLDEGILTKNRAKNYHRRNILLSVLTPSQAIDLQYTSFEIQRGDRILLLSDGAYALASKTELRDLSVGSNRVDNYCMQIKSLIETKKIRDDYTVVAFEASY